MMLGICPRNVLGAALLVPLVACGGRDERADAGRVTLVLGAYTTPREAYGEAIIPAFQAYWKTRTGQEVVFRESYQGSGAQARAIEGGFEADVAALSLEADIDKLAEAGGYLRRALDGPLESSVSRALGWAA